MSETCNYAMSRYNVFKRSLILNSLSNFIRDNQTIINSTVFQGTLYELVTMKELKNKLGMESLVQVGGAHDGGVDILGKWALNPIFTKMNSLFKLSENYGVNIPLKDKIGKLTIEPLYHRLITDKIVKLDTIIQCKSLTKSKLAPREVREIMGTFVSKIPIRKRKSTIAFICSPNLLTKDAIKIINELPIPLIYLRISQLERIDKNDFDLEKTGHLLNYYENDYAQKLLQNCGIRELIKTTLGNEN